MRGLSLGISQFYIFRTFSPFPYASDLLHADPAGAFNRALRVFQCLDQPSRADVALVANVQVPAAQQDCAATDHGGAVVHRGLVKRQGKGEAVDGDPDNHVTACQGCDSVENGVRHGEWALDDVAAACEDVGQDEGEVTETAHYDEGADESRKRCGGANVHKS